LVLNIEKKAKQLPVRNVIKVAIWVSLQERRGGEMLFINFFSLKLYIYFDMATLLSFEHNKTSFQKYTGS